MELLERASALAELESKLQGARAGRGVIAFVGGEAGIGKTSLIGRFVDMHRSSIRVLWGGCDALNTRRPLSPVYDIVQQMHHARRPPLDLTKGGIELFAAFLEMVDTEPTIVVFEDVHWADEATLDLLLYLGRRVERTRTLLIASYRDDELALTDPLRILLGDLATAGAHRITLFPLSVAAVRNLAGTRPIDVEALHWQTGGNPFFVTEVLAMGDSGMPPTVRDAVLARAARLGSSGRAVLEAAAIAGIQAEWWLLRSMVGAESDAIDECLVKGLLRSNNESIGFRHELARQAIMETMPPQRKRVLNGQALHALRTEPSTQADFVRLTHHAIEAGDQDATLAFAPPAARQARALGAHRDAAKLFASALRWQRNLSPADLAALLEEYAQECDTIGRLADAIEARQRAIEIWRASGDVFRVGTNLCRLVPVFANAGRNKEAEEASRQALEVLEPLPPSRVLALALRMRSYLYMLNRNNVEAVEWGERAITLAAEFQDQTTLAMTYDTVGSAWLFLDYERGCEMLQQSLALSRQLGMDLFVRSAYCGLGTGSGEVGRLNPAMRYLTEGIDFCNEREIDCSYERSWQALCLAYLGRWDEAARIAESILADRRDRKISRVTALLTLGLLRLRRGDPGVGEALDEALALAIETGHLQRIAPVRAARAEAAWLGGNVSGTLAEAAAIYGLAHAYRHAWFTGELLFWQAQAGRSVSVPDFAARPFTLHIAGEWRAAAAQWQQLGYPYEQARALADGDLAAQREALAIFEHLGALPMAERVRRQLRAAGARGVARGPRASTRENTVGLTNKELQVLMLLVQGLRNREIAGCLSRSTRTIDHHVESIFGKLEVANRAEAISAAHRLGLLPPTSTQSR